MKRCPDNEGVLIEKRCPIYNNVTHSSVVTVA